MAGRKTGARSLTADLRRRTDDELTALLDRRPDLVHPVPADLAALANRATTGASVTRAMEDLDAGALAVLEVLAALADPAPLGALTEAMPGVDAEWATDTVADLRARALVWGDDDALHLVGPVRQAIGEQPGGLGPALAAVRPGVRRWLEPGALDAALTDAPAEAREILGQMAWGPAYGALADADRVVGEDDVRTPVEWLLARDLLVPVERNRVALPREIALTLRGGAVLREVPTAPPPVAARASVDPARVDATAGQAAYDLVRLVGRLLEAWSAAPPRVLRSGGLGVRDLARAAAILDLDTTVAAAVVETAYAAGLLAPDGDVPESWCPTAAYDAWLDLEPAAQWATLAHAWLTTSRVPALLTSQPRPNVLSAELERPRAPRLRRDVLAALAAVPLGDAPVVDDLCAAVAWRHPRRRGGLADLMLPATLAEADLIGVTGLGALSAPGRALLAVADLAPARPPRPGRPAVDETLADAVRPLLPALVDQVLLQADLTAVAPGPLTPDAAVDLELVADVESRGAATVYRIGEASVRRALDSGRSGGDVLDLLRRRSRTPVPQPLEYLVGDVARRHGALRVGVAASYLRCDDPGTLAALLADRGAAGLELTRLADTVVVSPEPPDVVLATLRASGFSPMAESTDGTVVVTRPAARRAPTRRAFHPPTGPITSPELTAAAVRALRAGEQAAANRPEELPFEGGSGRLPRTSTAETLDVLRAALDRRAGVWIGYADTAGTVTERVVEPMSLEAGALTAYDLRSAEVRTFAVARITAAAPVAS